MTDFGSKLRHKVSKSLDIWRKILTLINYSSRRQATLVLLIMSLEIAFTLGGFVAVKFVIDAVAHTPDVSAESGRIFGLISLVLVLFLIGRILQSIASYYRSAQGFLVSDHVSQEIQKRAVAADLSFFDSSKYYDSLERARQAGSQRPALVVANAMSVLRATLLLLGVVIMFASIEARLLPVIVIAALLVLLVQVHFTRARFDRQRVLVQTERQAGYVDWIMTAQGFAKEIRLWGLGRYLQDRYIKVRENVRSEYLGIERQKTVSEIAVTLIGTALFIGSAGFLLHQVSRGHSTLSEMVLVVLLLQRGEAAGRELVINLAKLYDDQLFLNQLFSFLEVKSKIQTEEEGHPLGERPPETVKLENVSFTYPQSPAPALKGVTLELKRGQFTALVGGNGSGKTTLIKILCRLYDPQDGKVLLDGQDIRDFNSSDYRRQFSVIFQDFASFAFSAADNIRVADLTHGQKDERMFQAARLTAADKVIEGLPEGYDTMLSRMFDNGVELSGGQWQKIALARAVFPDSNFIILDEPTSAIDPNAEADLFDSFREKMEGRGALVISHRLSTIRQADYTYVLDDGMIVEEGSHDDLIAANGKYAEMFKRQSRGYSSA